MHAPRVLARSWLVVSIVVAACGEDAAPRDVGDDVVDVAVDVVLDGEADADTVTATDVGGDTGAVDTHDVADVDAGPGAFALACVGSEQCSVGCARGTCRAGRCDFAGPHPSASGCVIAAGDEGQCVARGAARPDQPACFFCNPGVDAGGFVNLAFADDFEAGGAQIAVEKLVATPATWVITTARAATGLHSLYFGDPAAMTYDVGERAAAVARTLPIEAPAGAELELSFLVWAETEGTDGYDRLRVLVEDGEARREVWSSDVLGGSTGGVFTPVTVALGGVPAGARIAFEADTIDGIINRFEGFYLDAVRVATTCCDPGAGSAASDCDDNDPCTVDGCVPDGEAAAGGACGHTPIIGCCLSDASCEDGNPCTADRCSAPGGTCSSAVIPGCCAGASDCDDRDPCTEDRCVEVACAHAPLCCDGDGDCDDGDPCTSGRCDGGQCRYTSACCREDADCDDGLACTDDRCDNGTCRNAFTYAPGCCIPDVLTEGFDDSALTPGGWTLSPIVNNVGWQVLSSSEARSDPALLYYGHKTLGFYETGGRNQGTAATPFVRLPDGVQLELSFMVLADIEASTTRDTFEVQAVVGNQVVALVGKAELVLGAWQEVHVDLSFAAGQLVQVRFVFDTVDGVANTRRGLFVDDVRILSSCLPIVPVGPEVPDGPDGDDPP